jgi:hypothetical protein
VNATNRSRTAALVKYCAILVPLLALAAVACTGAKGSGGTGGTGGAGGSVSTGSTGTTSSASSTGGGGTGGVSTSSSSASSGGGIVCAPMSTAPCYDGPPGTQGVGVCVAGSKTCAGDGLSYGACAGQVTPSTEICGTPVDESCHGAPGCAGACVWSKRFGDAAFQTSGILATGANGDIIYSANTELSIDLGGGVLTGVNGGGNYAVGKLDSAGQLLFSTMVSASNSGALQSIALDASGNTVMSGYFSGTLALAGATLAVAGSTTLFVIKLDPAGALLWEHHYAGAGNSRLAIDAGGNVVIAATFNDVVDLGGGTSLFPAGLHDVLLAKFDPSGGLLWGKGFGSSQDDGLGGLAIGPSGEIVLAAALGGSASFGGPIVGPARVFVKLDPGGNHLWTRAFATQNFGTLAVGIDAAGNVFSHGTFKGTVDFGGGHTLTSTPVGPDPSASPSFDVYVAKLSPAGLVLFATGYGGAADESPGGFAVDAAGQSAFTTILPFGMNPLAVVKLDASGALVWSHAYGGTSSSFLGFLAVDPTGALLVGGATNPTLDLGCGTLVSAGSGDAVLAKLTP